MFARVLNSIPYLITAFCTEIYSYVFRLCITARLVVFILLVRKYLAYSHQSRVTQQHVLEGAVFFLLYLLACSITLYLVILHATYIEFTLVHYIVRMYVRTYVYMYVCMYVLSMYYVCTYVCMCMYVLCMYVCMYVCMCCVRQSQNTSISSLTILSDFYNIQLVSLRRRN